MTSPPRGTPGPAPGPVLPACVPPGLVSIVVPTLNEERYIADCLHSLVACASGCEFEIMVMDGGSSDATRDIVRALARSMPSVSLHDNPRRLQSAAVNLAARTASPRAGVILRADAHALYPPGFVRHCLDALATHGAASVVVPMRTAGHGGMQRAIAAAQSSRLGNGGSAHRAGQGASGFVEHGHHAAFDRGTFLGLGGYDERFTHNEDAEYDIRLGLAGGRIWMCREAAVTYFPRDSLPGLWRQYGRHGRGRARTLLLHRVRPKPRQLAPVCILLGCAAGLALSPLDPWFLLVPALYAGLCLGWGAWRSVAEREPWLLASGAAVVVMHLAWACGFLREAAATGLRRPAA